MRTFTVAVASFSAIVASMLSIPYCAAPRPVPATPVPYDRTRRLAPRSGRQRTAWYKRGHRSCPVRHTGGPGLAASPLKVASQDVCPPPVLRRRGTCDLHPPAGEQVAIIQCAISLPSDATIGIQLLSGPGRSGSPCSASAGRRCEVAPRSVSSGSGSRRPARASRTSAYGLLGGLAPQNLARARCSELSTLHHRGAVDEGVNHAAGPHIRTQRTWPVIATVPPKGSAWPSPATRSPPTSR